jgi:hypothetical protein
LFLKVSGNADRSRAWLFVANLKKSSTMYDVHHKRKFRHPFGRRIVAINQSIVPACGQHAFSRTQTGQRLSRQREMKRLEAERVRVREVEGIKASVQEHHLLKSRGAWETRADQRAAMAQATREEAAHAQLAAAAVAEQRQAQMKARHCLQAAREAEAAAAILTPSQRRAMLAEQARALAARRESERALEAEQKLEQQFASSCDLLRTLQSQRAGQAAAAEWQQQIGERRAASAAAQAADVQGQQEFEQYMQRWEDRFQQVRRAWRAGNDSRSKQGPAWLCASCSLIHSA